MDERGIIDIGDASVLVGALRDPHSDAECVDRADQREDGDIDAEDIPALVEAILPP
ncbi:MAG TPA: hypothetical protein VMV94_21600 [Phycisphaerae bacterium]|nr:hypothetical protein [Phycisphaerae bacterium]